MKAYVPKNGTANISNNECSFDYPDDMNKILRYLHTNGKLLAWPKTVERLYRDFSNTYASGWIEPTDERLEEFANWLSEIEV